MLKLRMKMMKEKKKNLDVSAVGEGIKSKRRWKNGTVAIREIRKLTKTTNPLINKMPFRRVVMDILSRLGSEMK